MKDKRDAPMEMQFEWNMAKRFTKGFTFVETLLVLLMIVGLSGVFHLPKRLVMDRPLLGIVDVQLEAMVTSKRHYLMDNLWFNGRGNINQGQTVRYQGFVCVFQLGMGRYRCET